MTIESGHQLSFLADMYLSLNLFTHADLASPNRDSLETEWNLLEPAC
jgi:hypothetical protein